MTNLSEYLLENSDEAAGFWFRYGLKYYEQQAPDQMERHLLLLGLFYATKNKKMAAEGLYSEALNKMKDDTNMTKALGLNLMGRVLMSSTDARRKDQAVKLLKESEDMTSKLPFWWDKLEHMMLPRLEMEL
jgi:hypothetical protein